MDAGAGMELQRVAAAVRKWAGGSLPVRAAVEVALTTSLVEVVPRYLDWVSEDVAKVDFGRLAGEAEAHPALWAQSTGVLVRLAANLAEGPSGAGAGVDLRDLWLLDERNRRAVFKALRETLLDHGAFQHGATGEPDPAQPA